MVDVGTTHRDDLNFSIGGIMLQMKRSHTKLIERLSGESLAAVAKVAGRTVKELLERAGVKG